MTEPVATVLDILARTPSRPRHEHRFQQATATVTLRTDHPEVLRSAIDMLYAYRTTPPAPSRWAIALHTSTYLESELAARTFDAAPTHDIGPRLHARSLDAPGGRTYWVPAHATLLHADHDTATITVYCADSRAGVHWAARLVRQAMTAQLLATGAVYAHCAAFLHHGIGVLVAGHKGTGKTTTLLAALRMLGADFVTNDRLLLYREGPDVVGLAWPHHLRAGIGTLLALPGLAELVPARLRAVPAAQRRQHQEKIAIEPPALARLLAGGIVTDTVRPRLMVWPYLSAAGAAPERVPLDAMREELLTTRLFMHNPAIGASAHVNHWLIGHRTAEQTTANLRDVIDALAATTPCYRLPVSDDPTTLAVKLTHLLAGLPEPAPSGASNGAGS